MADLVINFKKALNRPQIVISKKVSKKAVERNRTKRIIREALRDLNLRKLNIRIIVKNNIAYLKKDQVRKIISQILPKL